MMKPPDQIIGKKESVNFDSTGRPHHFLFYTTTPKFSQLLHVSQYFCIFVNIFQLKLCDTIEPFQYRMQLQKLRN